MPKQKRIQRLSKRLYDKSGCEVHRQNGQIVPDSRSSCT